MSHTKWLSFLYVVFSTLFCVAACHYDNEEEKIPENANTIRVGVLSGIEIGFMQTVKEIATEKYDLKIELVSYADFAEINKALADEEIDANIFQNKVYLAYSQKKYGYHFSNLGETYIYPLGVYSKKIKNILNLKKGAKIAIPDEPVNQARALFLLDKAGLIRMKSRSNLYAGTSDIAANPRGYKIMPFSAKVVANMLPIVDIAVINLGFALPAGLIPSKNALLLENPMSQYASIVAVREGEEDDPRMRALLEVLRSPKVEKAVQDIFHGLAVPAWK